MNNWLRAAVINRCLTIHWVDVLITRLFECFISDGYIREGREVSFSFPSILLQGKTLGSYSNGAMEQGRRVVTPPSPAPSSVRRVRLDELFYRSDGGGEKRNDDEINDAARWRPFFPSLVYLLYSPLRPCRRLRTSLSSFLSPHFIPLYLWTKHTYTHAASRRLHTHRQLAILIRNSASASWPE